MLETTLPGLAARDRQMPLDDQTWKPPEASIRWAFTKPKSSESTAADRLRRPRIEEPCLRPRAAQPGGHALRYGDGAPDHAVVDACCQAWNALVAEPDRLLSLYNQLYRDRVEP